MMSRMRFAAALAALLTATTPMRAEDAAAFFQTNCKSCHTIGAGKLVGPDLKGVTERKDKAWLSKFIQDPTPLLASDEYAKKILAEANNVPMPKLPGVTPAVADQLLAYIESQSGASASTAPAAPVVPFTAEEAAIGRRLFDGTRRLANRGPACIACHHVSGLGKLGGGVLGPDLTLVATRLGGTAALSGWLSAPPTATMQPTFRDRPFTPDEIRALVAFFEEAANGRAVSAQAATAISMADGVILFLSGVIGTIVLILILNFIWRNRFTAVREPLVKGEAQ